MDSQGWPSVCLHTVCHIPISFITQITNHIQQFSSSQFSHFRGHSQSHGTVTWQEEFKPDHIQVDQLHDVVAAQQWLIHSEYPGLRSFIFGLISAASSSPSSANPASSPISPNNLKWTNTLSWSPQFMTQHFHQETTTHEEVSYSTKQIHCTVARLI